MNILKSVLLLHFFDNVWFDISTVFHIYACEKLQFLSNAYFSKSIVIKYSTCYEKCSIEKRVFLKSSHLSTCYLNKSGVSQMRTMQNVY